MLRHAEDWQEWFAWYPVRKLNNKWVWGKIVFSRLCMYRRGDDLYSIRQYGDVFDVLTTVKNN